MDADVLRAEKEQLEARHGPWTAHNLRLAEGLYTIGPEPAGDEVKLRRVTQVVADVLGRLEGARILDLACLEGMYALELAARGADVVAIEGREANLAKARFGAKALGLEQRIDFELGDVRDLSRERHGEFDAVLCLGILYHLDERDVFPFVEQLAEVCRRVLVVDTHVAPTGKGERRHDGNVYQGHTLREHDPDATEDERLQAVWSSLDNPTAWAPTRPSLLSLLARRGFTTVAEVWVPAEPAKTPDRVTLVALKGEQQTPRVAPPPREDRASVPERAPLGARLPGGRLWRAGRFLLPAALRRRARRALGAETRRH